MSCFSVQFTIYSNIDSPSPERVIASSTIHIAVVPKIKDTSPVTIPPTPAPAAAPTAAATTALAFLIVLKCLKNFLSTCLPCIADFIGLVTIL